MLDGSHEPTTARMLGPARASGRGDILASAADLGAVALVRSLVGTMRDELGESRSLFWIATAEQRAGDVVSARDTLGTAVSYATDAHTRACIEARMMFPLEQAPRDESALRAMDALSARADLRRPPLTLASAPVTAGITLTIALFSSGILALGRSAPADLARLGGLALPAQLPRDAPRLVTYGLVHASASHLGLNLATLCLLGVLLEHRLGAARFALLYALSGLCAALCTLPLAAPGTVLVGASGSLFGLLGAALARFATDPVLRATPEGRRVLVALVAVPLVHFGPWGSGTAVSTAAHLGGLVAGLALGVILRRRP